MLSEIPKYLTIDYKFVHRCGIHWRTEPRPLRFYEALPRKWETCSMREAPLSEFEANPSFGEHR